MVFGDAGPSRDEKRPILGDPPPPSLSKPAFYTVDEAVEAVGVGRYQYHCIGAIVLGSLSQGIGECLPLLVLGNVSCYFSMTKYQRWVVLFCFNVGGLLGNLVGGTVIGSFT